MSKTKYTELPKVIRQIAETMLAKHRENDPESYNLDEAELLNCLARILEGKHPLKAFGSPGDWGYGTPIGDALLAAFKQPLPEPRRFTDEQVEAWMLRYNIGGSISEGRCALEDAATLHLTDVAF